MSGSDQNTRNEINIEEELKQLSITLQELNIEEARVRRQRVEVEQNIRSLQRERRRRSSSLSVQATAIRRDRHIDTIEVGDYVNFLTAGKYNSRGGTVIQVSNKRFISARDKYGITINREPENTEVVRKHYEHHDRRERF